MVDLGAIFLALMPCEPRKRIGSLEALADFFHSVKDVRYFCSSSSYFAVYV